MALIDLNRPPGEYLPEQRDHGCVSGDVEAVFRNHQERVIRLFKEARERNLACVGAVAWLTDPRVLDAMATIPTSLIVQKEDFLRRDIPAGGNFDAWKGRLRRQYEAIADSDRVGDPGIAFQRQNMPDPLGSMSYGGDPQISGVYAFGIRNDRSKEGGRRQPLMHNKFLAFIRGVVQAGTACEGEGDGASTLDFHWLVEAVWTGSCNLSLLAPRSRENTVIIRDPAIGNAYLHEWADMMALSEPPDWNSAWIDPQWRTGT